MMNFAIALSVEKNRQRLLRIAPLNKICYTAPQHTGLSMTKTEEIFEIARSAGRVITDLDKPENSYKLESLIWQGLQEKPLKTFMEYK